MLPERVKFRDKRLSEIEAKGLLKLPELVMVINSPPNLQHWIPS